MTFLWLSLPKYAKLAHLSWKEPNLNNNCMQVDFIWTSSWNVAKLLFFATRYLAIVDTSVGVLCELDFYTEMGWLCWQQVTWADILHPSFSPSVSSCFEIVRDLDFILIFIAQICDKLYLTISSEIIWNRTNVVTNLQSPQSCTLLDSSSPKVGGTVRFKFMSTHSKSMH